jgi:hypothetical protein
MDDLLPLEIKEKIGIELELSDLLNLCITNKEWNQVNTDDNFWINKLYHDYKVTSLKELSVKLYIKENRIVYTFIFCLKSVLDDFIIEINNHLRESLCKYISSIILDTYNHYKDHINIPSDTKDILSKLDYNSIQYGTLNTINIQNLYTDISRHEHKTVWGIDITLFPNNIFLKNVKVLKIIKMLIQEKIIKTPFSIDEFKGLLNFHFSKRGYHPLSIIVLECDLCNIKNMSIKYVDT